VTLFLHDLGLGTLAVRGPDAVSWLNGLLTQDLGNVAEGAALPALFLSKQGKVRASLVVVRELDQVTLGVAGLTAEQLGAELDPYLVMEDAEWTVEPGVRWLGGCVPALTREKLSQSELALAVDFPLFGPEGAIVVARGAADQTLGLELQLAHESEFAAFRVERGIPWIGFEYGETDNPHEASLDKTHVSFKKGCYLGQEVVCMQELRGKVKRRVVRLSADGALAELQSGATLVSISGEEVGQVTTAFGRHALGRVKAPSEAVDSELSCGPARCRVLALEPGLEWAPTDVADRVQA
jgi:tRNA-modifying protein YgfZ